jgi:hypothetical protein
MLPIKVGANPTKESGFEKAAEQPKVLVTSLSKLSATATSTLWKRRMATILDVVLESVKMPPPTSAEASGGEIEDARVMRPLEVVPEKLVEENLLEKTRNSRS